MEQGLSGAVAPEFALGAARFSWQRQPKSRYAFVVFGSLRGFCMTIRSKSHYLWLGVSFALACIIFLQVCRSRVTHWSRM